MQFTQDSMHAVLVVSPPNVLSWYDLKALEALQTADMKEYQKNMTKGMKWPHELRKKIISLFYSVGPSVINSSNILNSE